MHIVDVQLTVTDPAAAAVYFSETLGLPTDVDDLTAVVFVGTSRLTLKPGKVGAGVHHLAFDIPAATFTQHRVWLSERLPLLQNSVGATEFEGPADWDSRSVYFAGPDHMVLELICRRSRSQPPTGPVPQLMSISEVGVAVADVTATVQELVTRLDVDVLGQAADEFAPVGDHFGLLILVSPGREWLPVFDERAEPLPLHVTVRDSRSSPGVWSEATFQLNKVASLTTTT